MIESDLKETYPCEHLWQYSHMEEECNQHTEIANDEVIGGNCPDNIIVFNENKQHFGIGIYDRSYYPIKFCPWCGLKIKEVKSNKNNFIPDEDKINKLFKISFPDKPEFNLGDNDAFVFLGKKNDSENFPQYIIRKIGLDSYNNKTLTYSGNTFYIEIESFTVDELWFNEQKTGRKITWI